MKIVMVNDHIKCQICVKPGFVLQMIVEMSTRKIAKTVHDSDVRQAVSEDFICSIISNHRKTGVNEV